MTMPGLETAETIADALAAQARNHPGRLALAVARKGRRPDLYGEVSLGELERDANTFAEVFAHRGIRRGMRTVLMITPGREFCAAIFALLKLGAPPVFIDPGIGLRNIGICIQHAMPAAFIGIRKAQLARRVFGWGRDTIRISLTVETLPRGESGAAAAAPGEVLPVSHPVDTPEDQGIAAIAFTSGSTGPPKAVVFDHQNLLAQADLLGELLGPYAGEPHLATFPLFLLFAPVLGLAAIIPDMDTSKPGAADPVRLIAAIDDYKCRSTFVSPVLVRRLGSYCRDTTRKLSSIERVLSAGAPSDPNALATLAAAIAPGGEIFTPYGATEALPVSNLSSREILTETSAKTRRGAGVCIGRPLRGISASIIPIGDSLIHDWSEVPPLPRHEIGEITVSGGVVSRRYFNDPSATGRAKIPCRATGSLYHRMGDVGYLDDLGRLWMCGRKSHRVVTPKRVYFTVPAEGVFNGHGEVARTALVGVTRRQTTIPVLCVELAARQSAKAKKRIAEELRALGANFEHTREIRHFLYHRSFPVDARHNSKIRREDLAVWARKRIGTRNLEVKED
jgi:acyl-CoA synthetase (AMP-forming)/AMP-acid ligase II